MVSIPFSVFIKFRNNKWKNLLNNTAGQTIFATLSTPENIAKMIFASKAGIPALSLCVEEIEHLCTHLLTPHIDLADNRYKQAIGFMVKTILNEFGYVVPTNQKAVRPIPAIFRRKYFKNASIYTKVGSPRHSIQINIL